VLPYEHYLLLGHSCPAQALEIEMGAARRWQVAGWRREAISDVRAERVRLTRGRRQWYICRLKKFRM
jgi:hypothetical protein